MQIEDIPDKEFYAEYFRREKIKKENKEKLEKDMEEHRIFWLKSHGGTDGNDQCCDNYCRINCYNCDNGDHYEYDSDWKNKIKNNINNSNNNSNNITFSKRDKIIMEANEKLLKANNQKFIT